MISWMKLNFAKKNYAKLNYAKKNIQGDVNLQFFHNIQKI